MKAGACATFVVPWRDVELDGECPATEDYLSVGASWRRRGRAVSLDGQGHLLRLHGDEARAALRARAGRRLERGMAAAAISHDREDEIAEALGPQPVFSQAVVLTDGRRRYDAALIAHRRGPLFAFDGEIPPVGVELWVVRLPALPRRPASAMPPALPSGCAVATGDGEATVEELAAGQTVLTESGPSRVIELRRHRLSGARLAATPELRPMRLRAGALGGGLPRRDLLLGPAHRLRLRHPAARLLWGTEAAIVAAGDLDGWPGIRREPAAHGFDFVELRLERAGLVEAEGVACESGPGGGEAALAAGAGRAVSRGEAAIMARRDAT